MNIRTVLFVSLATVFVAAAVMARPVYSAPAPQGVNVPVSNDVTLMNEAQTYAYWTPQRMAAANANPFPPKEITWRPGQLPLALLIPPGDPGQAPGSAPGEPSKPMVFAEPSAIQLSTFAINYYSYPYPYTNSYMGAGWPNFYPMRTNAKMFFTQNSTDYVCSATVVTDGGAGVNRLVATAGQCVNDGAGHWDTSVLICPAYVAGHAGPWGCWSGSQLWALSLWTSGSDVRYDHGFVTVAHMSNTGQGDIGAVIGTNGVAWNQGYVWEIWSFGYPALSPYTGTTLVWTTSSTAVVDDPNGKGTPFTFGLGSNETAGATGGAWASQQRLAGSGYVISHNGYKYTSPAMPGAMFGPYQGNDWFALYDTARVANP